MNVGKKGHAGRHSSKEENAKPLKEETLSFTFSFFFNLEKGRKRGEMKEEGALSLVQRVCLKG
jgi:hypothetical protein